MTTRKSPLWQLRLVSAERLLSFLFLYCKNAPCSLVRRIRRLAEFSTNRGAFKPRNRPWHVQVCACYADHRYSSLLGPPKGTRECYQACLSLKCNAGFLGAGKTTLVHHILNASHNYRIAVIVNEFGDTSGIESAAVTSGQVSRLSDSMSTTCEGNTMTVGVVLQARYCCGAVCI